MRKPLLAKTKFSLYTFLLLVLLYPIILSIPNLFGVSSFFLTSPYFFGLFCLMSIFLFLRIKIPLHRYFILLIGLLLISLYNFSTLRYSLPIFYISYIIVSMTFLNLLRKKSIDFGEIPIIFFIYLILSMPFLFLENGWDETNRFVGFVGSPTVYAGIMVSLYVIIAEKWKTTSPTFILITMVVFCLVFLSKTRLVLIFIVLFPFMKFVLAKFHLLNKTRLFLLFFTLMKIGKKEMVESWRFLKRTIPLF